MFIILLAAFAAGCTLNRQDDFDVDYVLEFQPAMYMHLAAEGVERFPADQSFAVRAWALPEQDSWEYDAAGAEEFLPLTETVPMSDGRTWGCKTPVMWPTRHKRLTFYAYSPYSAGDDCDAVSGVSFMGMDVLNDDTDLLYTDPVTDVDKMDCGGVVALPFKHALCGMDFKVKNRVKDSERMIVRKITLESAYHKGDFRSMASPQWTLGQDMVPFVFFDGEYQTGHLPSRIGQRRMMIPQSLDSRVVVECEFVTEAGTRIVQRLSTVPLKTVLESGVSYTFTLSVGIDDVKFLVEIIEDSLVV